MIALHNEELSILFHFVDSNCTVYNFGIIVLSLGLPTVYRVGGGIIGRVSEETPHLEFLDPHRRRELKNIGLRYVQ